MFEIYPIKPASASDDSIDLNETPPVAGEQSRGLDANLIPIFPPDRQAVRTEREYKVLLVDDNELDRMLVKQLLVKGKVRYQLAEAASISDALQSVESVRFDAVLLDYRLPDGIGPEHIEGIRSQADDAHLPIVVLTGAGCEQTALGSFHEGASDYMPKDDMSTSSLGRAIEHSIHRAGLQRRINEQRTSMISANAALREQNREINSFYQTVSHELKTPLTAAREYVAIIRDGIMGEVNKEQSNLLTSAIDCCDTLKILVDDLFDAARFENNGMRMDLQRCDAQAMVGEALERVKFQVESRGSSIDYQCEANLPPVNIDCIRVMQVITNIVGNAAKFAPPESAINVAVSQVSLHKDSPAPKTDAVAAPTSAIQISVTDKGPGISQDMIEKIFEKFTQVEENTETRFKGMGLGLYLCKKIIEAHSGKIWVESKLGEGSTFAFLIPCIVDQPE